MKFTVLAVIAATIFLWLYQIDIFPGLHGDEAWFGIEAYQYLTNPSASFKWNGMNHYTGSLQQNLASLAFSWFGAHISTLRIPGAVINIIALALFFFSLPNIPQSGRKTLCFFLFLTQSALWMIYPRIAWEVNAMTLFFMSLMVRSSIQIWNNDYHFSTISLFLFASLLGGYNHIIFVCIPLSVLSATVLYGLRKQEFNLNWLLLSIGSLFNSSILFGLMFIERGIFFNENAYWIVPLLALLILSESWLIIRWGKKKLKIDFISPPARTWTWIKGIVLAFLVIAFLKNHATGLYAVLSNHKVLEHIYSFTPHPSVAFLSQLAAAALLAASAIAMFRDLKADKSPLPLFILSYMGLLSLFTTANSPRYYLSLSIILFLYLAIKTSQSKYYSSAIIVLAVTSVLTVILQLYLIYSDEARVWHPKQVAFGNITEPSSHFLPITPVVNYLRENRIHRVESNFEGKFIVWCTHFMELTRPWEKDAGTKIYVEYGETAKNGGFVIKEQP